MGKDIFAEVIIHFVDLGGIDLIITVLFLLFFSIRIYIHTVLRYKMLGWFMV